MALDAHDGPAPVLLVGEAAEDWSRDARFHEYSVAADPIGSGAIPMVPIEQFPPTLYDAVGTGVVPLDLSDRLGVPYHATSPALLASFVVLEPGHSLVTTPDATSELHYVLNGRGRTEFERPDGGTGPTGGTIDWADGDFVVLPSGCTSRHTADGDRRCVLYRVTDAPLLAYLGVAPGPARFAPTRFGGDAAQSSLAAVAAHPDADSRNRISVLLGNAALPQTLTVTHTLWAMLGVLPAGRVQRPHRHQSVALDLITDCADGCYSLLGSALDAQGQIIDPVRVDWQMGGAFVTPPGLWHSHHNESDRPAHLVPVQDAGLHTYLRSLDIRFTTGG